MGERYNSRLDQRIGRDVLLIRDLHTFATSQLVQYIIKELDNEIGSLQLKFNKLKPR
jgi:hypothetical protein